MASVWEAILGYIESQESQSGLGRRKEGKESRWDRERKEAREGEECKKEEKLVLVLDFLLFSEKTFIP